MKQTMSLVLSSTAVVIATLGSTPLGEAARSTAAQVVPRNSIGPLQLKRNAVTARTLSPNAVRAGHVLDGSLLAADFKAGQLPAGPKGDKGDRGDTGASATRLWAKVAQDGTLIRGSGVEGARRGTIGEYSVEFNRDVEQCATVASTERYWVNAEAESDGGRFVVVRTGQATSPNGGTRQDAEFSLAVFC